MKLVNKLEYIHAKIKSKASQMSNETITISDNEFENLSNYLTYIEDIPNESEELETYTITFKDGDEIIRTVTGEPGTYVSAPNVAKEGYEFDGWSIDGINVTMPVDGIVDSNITYIAIWSNIQYPETIEVDGITYYKEIPESPGEDYKLKTIYKNNYAIPYYAWINCPETLEYNNLTYYKNIHNDPGQGYELLTYNYLKICKYYTYIENNQLTFDIYEDENNDLILDIKGNEITNAYISVNNQEFSLSYGINIITPLIKYAEIYQYSYDKKYTLNKLILRYKDNTYGYDILFTLNNDLEYYEYKVTQDPKFNFYIDEDPHKIELVSPLKYIYKNIEYTVNSIENFEFNISGNNVINGIIVNNYFEFSSNFETFNYSLTKYTNSSSYYNFDSYSFNSGYYRGPYIYIKINCYINNVIISEYTKNLFNRDGYNALLCDPYNLFYKEGQALMNNLETINIYKNIYTNNDFDTFNYYPQGIFYNCYNLNYNLLNYICQQLNCQESALNIYTNYKYSFLHEYDDNIINLINDFNNENIIKIIQNENLIKHKIYYSNYPNYSYYNNSIIHYISNEDLINGEYYDELNNMYIPTISIFKLFITANNIDYITINIGWHIMYRENSINPYIHLLIDPETEEKTIIEDPYPETIEKYGETFYKTPQQNPGANYEKIGIKYNEYDNYPYYCWFYYPESIEENGITYYKNRNNAISIDYYSGKYFYENTPFEKYYYYLDESKIPE